MMKKTIIDLSIVILCGGRGTRLRPMTTEIPKALVPLKGKPIIDYIFDFFLKKGFKKFVLCIGYKGEMIRNHIKTKNYPCFIDFSDAGENSGMLKRIYKTKDNLSDDFLVCYGDTLVELDVHKLLNHHQKKNALATLVTSKIRNPFGIVTFNSSLMATSFVEKPLLDYFIGCFVMNRQILFNTPEKYLRKRDGLGLIDFFGSLIKDQRLAVFVHKGVQISFNTENERQLAEEKLDHFFTLNEKEIRQ